MNENISLAHGAGGKEMDELIKSLGISFRAEWKHCDDDAAVLAVGDRKLALTTDSFIVDPVFFPGGNIGHLAMCGTINDLAVMGAIPLGISLAAVIEEGFPLKDLERIMKTVREVSEQTQVPIVTGDTKVMEKGKVDKIILNSSAVGFVEKLLNKRPVKGDQVIISSGIGEHAVAILSKRYEYSTSVESDCRPLLEPLSKISAHIKAAKDVTRGGLASVLNELARRFSLSIILQEEKIPVRSQVRTVVEMLGFDIYGLACEGCFVCIAERDNADYVVKKLKGFDKRAEVIGEIDAGDKVYLQTMLGKRVLPVPRGRLVPRIC